MKRSEVLNIISNTIHHTRRATEAWTSNEIGETILSDLEKIGMLPPQTPADGCIIIFNGWEPEEDPDDPENYCGAV